LRRLGEHQPSFSIFQHMKISTMRSGRINNVPTSQDAPAHVYHTKQKHPAGKGSLVASVTLPKTMHVDRFPVGYVVSVTPSGPAIVSVSNQTKYGFDVTLTSPNGGALSEGSFTVLVVG
jgi:hypothetical protein